MKPVVLSLLSMLAVGVCSTVASAQEAPQIEQTTQSVSDADKRLALANRFIALMQTDQMGEMISQMAVAFVPNRPDLTTEEAIAVQQFVTRASARMMPRMFEAMAPIYADMFNMEELTALVAFYESDVGRSMVRKSYEAGPQITAAIMSIMPEITTSIVDLMCEERGCTDEQRAQIDAAIQAQYVSSQ